MKSEDPLSSLLRQWQPRNPHPTERFVQDTLRKLRQDRARPAWLIWIGQWGDFLEEWLPSPRILIPAAASLMLLTTVLQWKQGAEKARLVAADRWHQELNQPLAGVSLSGAYAQLSREPFP